MCVHVPEDSTPTSSPPQDAQNCGKDGCSLSLELVKLFITLASAGIAFILGLASSATSKLPFLIVGGVLLLMVISIISGILCHSRLTGLIAKNNNYDAYERIYMSLAKWQFLSFGFGFLLLASCTIYNLWRTSNTPEKIDPVPILTQSITNLLTKTEFLLATQTNFINLVAAQNSNQMAGQVTYSPLETNLLNEANALLALLQPQQAFENSEVLRLEREQFQAMESQRKTLQKIVNGLQQSSNLVPTLANISDEIGSIRQELKLQAALSTNKAPAKSRWNFGIGFSSERGTSNK